MVDENYRVCAFTFPKKTGEDVLFWFMQTKDGKMQITMNVCSGDDVKYKRVEGFIARTDEFYGRVEYHPRVNSYTIPVRHGDSNVTQLRWDFFNEPEHSKKVRLKISAQESNDNGSVLIDEYIDTSINDSIPALQRFLELYVIPHASVNYQVHPEVDKRM